MESSSLTALATLVAAFSGSGFAFLLNYYHEKIKKNELEISNLEVARYIFNGQANSFKNLKGELNSTFEEKKLKGMQIFYKNGFPVDIEPIMGRELISWLYYGESIDLFKILEVKSKEIIFLAAKERLAVKLLDKILTLSLEYQTVTSLLDKRNILLIEVQKYFDELDYSCADEKELREKLRNNFRISDKLNRGKLFNKQLLDALEEYPNEFKKCIDAIDIYIAVNNKKSCFLKNIF